MRTRVGYAGGTTENPTYENIGDHTEALQIDYDPDVISYGELLEIFWKSHSPTARSWSTQYRSAIFTMDDEQAGIAAKSTARLQMSIGGKVHTALEPLGRFYLAEGYHQKYYLQQDHVLMTDFMGIYPELEDFVNSPAAAKANGFMSGVGSAEELTRYLHLLGLSEDGKRRLLLRVR